MFWYHGLICKKEKLQKGGYFIWFFLTLVSKKKHVSDIFLEKKKEEKELYKKISLKRKKLNRFRIRTFGLRTRFRNRQPANQWDIFVLVYQFFYFLCALYSESDSKSNRLIPLYVFLYTYGTVLYVPTPALSLSPSRSPSPANSRSPPRRAPTPSPPVRARATSPHSDPVPASPLSDGMACTASLPPSGGFLRGRRWSNRPGRASSSTSWIEDKARANAAPTHLCGGESRIAPSSNESWVQEQKPSSSVAGAGEKKSRFHRGDGNGKNLAEMFAGSSIVPPDPKDLPLPTLLLLPRFVDWFLGFIFLSIDFLASSFFRLHSFTNAGLFDFDFLLDSFFISFFLFFFLGLILSLILIFLIDSFLFLSFYSFLFLGLILFLLFSIFFDLSASWFLDCFIWFIFFISLSLILLLDSFFISLLLDF